MKKIYIFMTGDIHPIGGMQLLASGKAEVLEAQGWQVVMFFPSHGRGPCAIDALNKYDAGGMIELSLPPYKWRNMTRKKVINKMKKLIGTITKEDQVIIESHADRSSQWGEILAAELHAKHMIFLCSEKYRGKGKYYLENLDFYDWKHRRREVAGETQAEFDMLFEGYKDVPLNEVNIFMYDENPVRDVKNELIEAIPKFDWNIGYIGRLEKGYVPNIINSVAVFAKSHAEKKIQFVVVGDISARRKLVEEEFKECPNLYLNALGNVVPIPKALFTKLDVVIAGSGSAKCAVYEGVYTILADAENFLSNGVYGYDTDDYLYHNQVNQSSFSESLERVLVTKEYCGRQMILPPYMGPDKCTEQNFELIEESIQTMEYYPESKLCSAKINYAEIFAVRTYDLLCKSLPRVATLLKSMKRKWCGDL